MSESILKRSITSRVLDQIQSLGTEQIVRRTLLLSLTLILALLLVIPLLFLFVKGFQNEEGVFVGVDNFINYFKNPVLFSSLGNSLFVSATSASITVLIASLFAYTIERTCAPFKSFFKLAMQIPLLAPSLLSAISLIYLFGNQGMLKGVLFENGIYGPAGIIIGEIFWTLPHAMIIIMAGFSGSDARLYEAAESLGASKLRTFFTVTLPGVKYALISSWFVSFTLVITDFGVPKVIGGQYSVLATDIYQQVVGLQNFEMGAVVGMILMVPAVVTFAVERFIQRRQTSFVTSKSVPYHPKKSPMKDTAFFLLCAFISLLLLGILAVAAYASFIKFWPYNTNLTLDNYRFDVSSVSGWTPYFNSIKMAFLTMITGTFFIFIAAYCNEKFKAFPFVRLINHLMSMLSMGIPGMVLGLSYLMFISADNSPVAFLGDTMAILVLVTVAHFYTVTHLTAVTSLKQQDKEFESVSDSLKVPFYKTLFRVSFPLNAKAIFDMGIYLFLNAMTTVSAIVFLYSADTEIASISILNLDEMGETAPAAALAMMIVYTSLAVRLIHSYISKSIGKTLSKWKGSR